MSANAFPPPGLCAFSALPEPYQTAFRQGSAQHLPGQFLPAQTDWFLQIFLLPLGLMYASPLLVLIPSLIAQAIREPDSYLRFWQKTMAFSPLGRIVILLLLLLIAVLIGFMADQAWGYAQGLYRTWRATRMRQRGEHGYGLVLLSHGLVGRLVDSVERHHCLWLPRTAIAEIAWQQMREEGAKHARWVNRTRICYLTADQQRRWLTLKGGLVQLGYSEGDPRSDRALYDTLIAWWQDA
jgi:hypothetical protein